MNKNDVTLSSALFQAACLLESKYPIGSEERQIADICWQAAECIENEKPPAPEGTGGKSVGSQRIG